MHARYPQDRRMDEAREIVICGLDGVLALIEHRLHHLYNEEGERNWDAFYAACVEDMPNLPLIDRLNQARAEGVPVMLVSGRSASVRRETEQWLQQWQIGYDGLWLRPPANRQRNAEFKADLIARQFGDSTIRRIYESAQHLDMARWCLEQGIPYTLVGHNQGNGEEREQLELKVIRHACDHTILYPFYGDDDYVWEERAAQLAAQHCRVCQAEEQAEEQRRKSQQARYHAKERGLPPLEGSERQVSWAETIRLNAFGAIDKVNAWVEQVNAQAEEEDPDHWHSVRQGIDKACAWLEEQVEAKWWIDHRHGIFNNLDAGRALLSAVAQELGYF